MCIALLWLYCYIIVYAYTIHQYFVPGTYCIRPVYTLAVLHGGAVGVPVVTLFQNVSHD